MIPPHASSGAAPTRPVWSGARALTAVWPCLSFHRWTHRWRDPTSRSRSAQSRSSRSRSSAVHAQRRTARSVLMPPRRRGNGRVRRTQISWATSSPPRACTSSAPGRCASRICSTRCRHRRRCRRYRRGAHDPARRHGLLLRLRRRAKPAGVAGPPAGGLVVGQRARRGRDRLGQLFAAPGSNPRLAEGLGQVCYPRSATLMLEPCLGQTRRERAACATACGSRRRSSGARRC